MKTKDKIFIIFMCILVALFLFILNPNVAHSESDYFFFRKYIAQPIDKEWTITFSRPVNFNTVTDGAIHIKDKNNTDIPIEITPSADMRKVYVAGDWEYGEEYTIYIENTIKSTSSGAVFLKRNVMLPFSIIDKNQYRFELTWNTQSDLDLNLMLPDNAVVNVTNPIHEMAEIDMDIVSGFGAENILLRGVERNKLYKIYVTSFGGLADSGAKVNVYNDAGLVRSFEIPDNWNRSEWIACYMYGDLLIAGDRY